MFERIQSIREKGKEILLVDVSNCQPSEVETIARTVPNYLATRARSSVLLLVDFSGASIDAEAARTLKESAVFHKPYIKKSAWIGDRNFPQAFYTEIASFARRDVPVFNSRQDAVAWLIRD